MLILSRRPLEQIRIGDDIIVTVLAIHGCRVRVGIDAPKEMLILRSELNDLVADASPLQKWVY
jgi:carbon storage regulator